MDELYGTLRRERIWKASQGLCVIKVNVSTAILVLTSGTAGLIDVLSFAKLHGVFTSAMTGNLALLGFYAATGAVHSAIKSLSALGAFVVGCAVGTLQGRAKTTRSAARSILGLEILIVAVCAIGSMQPLLSARGDFLEVETLMLGFAMGLQSIVGNQFKQPNVVFTTTLIRIVSAALESTHDEGKAAETRRQTAVVAAYLAGALTSGLLITSGFGGILLIPVAALGVAFFFANRLDAI
ncbi:MAG: YoaK family protein [Candidatus Binataceae bacterium]